MRTDAERMQLIRTRTAQLQREERARRRHWVDLGCVAACLAFVIYLGIKMPGWVGGPVTMTVSSTAIAGMMSEAGVDGYVLIGLLSFLLGCCVTILLYRLRRRNEKKPPEDHHEL